MDLQSFLHQYEADYPDRVWHIRTDVPRDHFTTTVMLEAERMLEPPVPVFERVSGPDMPVVTGLFSSRSRMAAAIGTTAEQLHEHQTHISQNLMPPVEVSGGLCQEVCYWGDEANRREPEGPFGQYTGYSTGRSSQNVFKLRAITHRTKPYFLDVCPGASRDHLSSKIAIDATRPLDWEPQRCTLPTEIAREARELISSHRRDLA